MGHPMLDPLVRRKLGLHQCLLVHQVLLMLEFVKLVEHKSHFQLGVYLLVSILPEF